jgi:hypothetical protein
MTCVGYGLPVEDWLLERRGRGLVVASAPIEFTRGKGEIDGGVLICSCHVPRGKRVVFSTGGGVENCNLKWRILSLRRASLHHMSHNPALAWARNRELLADQQYPYNVA